jgi:hypothetical protein
MMIEMLADESGLSAGQVLAMPSEKAAELIESGVARAADDQTEPKAAAPKKKKAERAKSKRAGQEVEEAVAEAAPEER